MKKTALVFVDKFGELWILEDLGFTVAGWTFWRNDESPCRALGSKHLQLEYLGEL